MSVNFLIINIIFPWTIMSVTMRKTMNLKMIMVNIYNIVKLELENIYINKNSESNQNSEYVQDEEGVDMDFNVIIDF